VIFWEIFKKPSKKINTTGNFCHLSKAYDVLNDTIFLPELDAYDMRSIIKFTLEQATNYPEGSRGIALLFP
jgi:hypothetical protein